MITRDIKKLYSHFSIFTRALVRTLSVSFTVTLAGTFTVVPYAYAETCYPLKSLKSLYGVDNVPVAKAIVGVIGSGIDYNHPGMARFLAVRAELESKLQKIEKISNVESLTPCEYQKIQQERNVGFPLWMDQAFKTPWPMDQVFQNGILKPNLNHETRVASRIMYGRDDVAVHFVRRMFGSDRDIFNAAQVIENFANHGVQVVNMSFGSDCGVLPREEQSWSLLFKLYPQLIFVVSAGNSGRNLNYFEYCPAKFSRDNPNVISVTSVTSDGNISVNYDPEAGRDVLVNYGTSVDVAIRADGLSVLVPYTYYDDNDSQWIRQTTGWTSHAAAEVTRVIAHAIADGLPVRSATVKQQLIRTSRKKRYLNEFVKSGGEVDELSFRANLALPTAHTSERSSTAQ